MMLCRRFAVVAVTAAVLTVVSSGLPLIAQEPGASTTEPRTKGKTGKRSFDPSRRVPMYFGQLGLTETQREAIYQIQGKHMPKIEALEKQIEDLRAQMVHECEGVLTAPQKQILEHRRGGAAETKAKRGPTAKPQP